jgi:GH25 family lysozyme M1 (1,4-beta-N-acetylmuramidase)
MKKRALLKLFFAAAMLIFVTGCGKSKEADAEPAAYNEDNIFHLIQEANTREAYLENHERLAYEVTYHYPDDTEETIYTYQDTERYVYEDNYSLIIADSEGVYGKDVQNEQGYRMLFVGEGAKEDYLMQCPISWYDYAETEQIKSMSAKRGVLSIQSYDTDIDYIKGFLEAYGYPVDDIEKISYAYKIDESNFEIKKLEVFADTFSGEQLPISELSRVKRCKQYKVDKKLLENIFQGEQVTLTVVADASTDQEMVYEQTVSKDCGFYVSMLPEYEQKYFADPEYKQEVSFDRFQFEEDTILYVKHPDKILIAENAKETEELTFGIDVSKFQGTIDWAAAANEGIDFAMIRIGYRTEDTGEIKEDTNARFNMQEATKHGLKIGAYFFSTAISKEEAIEEAQWAADYISQYAITYPVVYDCENYESANSRQYALTKEERTDFAIAFLREIYEQGYTPMFYSSKNEMRDDAKWETSRIEKSFKIWVSQYPSAPYPETPESSYSGPHAMWQYTNDASVPGISTPVDMNVAYFGYENVIEPQNPEAPEIVKADVEALMSFKEVQEKVTAKDVTNLRDIPGQGDDSTVLMQLNNGEIAVRTGVSDSGWSRLIIDGQKYYAISQYLTTNLEYRTPDENGEGELKTQFTSVSQNVTPKIEVNLRKLPSVTNPDAVVAATVYAGEVFERTGINQEYGWSRVEYHGQTLYCVSSYLNIVE